MPLPLSDAATGPDTSDMAGPLRRLGRWILLVMMAAGSGIAAQQPEPVVPSDSAPAVLAAGDIARCDLIGGAVATARLLDRLPGTVLTLGDNAYESGTPEEFAKCYAPTWG